MRIEVEYHSNDRRWHWRVITLDYSGNNGTLAKDVIVREGFERDLLETERAARTAAVEYTQRKVLEL